MEVSMDGLRKSLSRDISYLKSLVIDAANMELHDRDELFEAMNQVIQDSNILNCVYNNDDDSFTDLSDIRIELIETDD